MKALGNVLLMVLNLIRLSNDLGSNLSVELLMLSVHKNPVGRLIEFVSEQSCVLVFFGIKKSESRPKTLKFVGRDMPR